MSGSKHPAILRFPAHAGRLSERMRSNQEFADICRDYVQIVEDIAREERAPSKSSAVLAELLRLKSDLECDIFNHLSAAEVDSREGP